MRNISFFFTLLLLCQGLLANTLASAPMVYHGAASQLGIGAISKAEAEISFGKLLSRKLRHSGVDLQIKVHDTSEQTLNAFRSGKANALITSAYEVAQVYNELDDHIFALRFKYSSEKQRLLLIVRKDLHAGKITDLAGKRLILGRRGGVGEAFLSVALLRNRLPEAKDFFGEMQIGRYASSAITDVFFGKYDASVVCEYEYKEAQMLNPQIDDVLTIIDASEPLLMLVGATRRADPDHHQTFIKALASFGNDEEGRKVFSTMQAESIVLLEKSELLPVKALYDEYQRLRNQQAVRRDRQQ